MMPGVVCLLLAVPITLDEVRAASRQNLDALKAEIELRRQQLGVTVAKSAIFPQLSLNTQFGGVVAGPRKDFGLVQKYETDPMTGQLVPVRDPTGKLVQEPGFNNSTANSRGNMFLSIGVNQLLYDGGRWWNQIAQAGAQARAAEGQLDEQRLASEFEAVSRFYQLLNAQYAQGVFENGVKRSQTQLDRARGLFEAGRGSKLDAIDSEVNAGNDRINVLRQRQTVTAAQVELLKWIGQPTHEVEAADPGTIAGDSEQRSAPKLDAVVAAARVHRPLLVALQAQVDAAEQAVDVAWAPFLPTVSAGLTYQRQATTLDPFFTDPSQNNQLSGGLNLSWQLFNGFGNQAQLQQARENLSQAKLQRERAELELDGDLRRALKALETQLLVAQIATENVRLSDSALKLAEERFTAGAGSTLEVRDAQVKLINAQLARLQSRVDVEIARAALKRVVGADVEETQ